MKKLELVIENLYKEYDNIMDDIHCEKANGSLSVLCNLREQFDETFDLYFDKKELRTKYNAWDIEADEPDFNFTNKDLESKLDEEDQLKFIDFLKGYIEQLKEELHELKGE